MDNYGILKYFIQEKKKSLLHLCGMAKVLSYFIMNPVAKDTQTQHSQLMSKYD